MIEDDSYGLDSDENGRYVRLCFTTEVLEVVLSEQQRDIRCRPGDHYASVRYRRCKASRGRQGRGPPR
eukprot:5491120-Pyramimonas_sp.AAC.1